MEETKCIAVSTSIASTIFNILKDPIKEESVKEIIKIVLTGVHAFFVVNLCNSEEDLDEVQSLIRKEIDLQCLICKTNFIYGKDF